MKYEILSIAESVSEEIISLHSVVLKSRIAPGEPRIKVGPSADEWGVRG
jgi:hypothetical protein